MNVAYEEFEEVMRRWLQPAVAELVISGRINHIDDADLKTLRSIADRLGNGFKMDDNERRNLSHLMGLILDRVETGEVELKEHEDG